jgi:hypothetical protein
MRGPCRFQYYWIYLHGEGIRVYWSSHHFVAVLHIPNIIISSSWKTLKIHVAFSLLVDSLLVFVAREWDLWLFSLPLVLQLQYKMMWKIVGPTAGSRNWETLIHLLTNHRRVKIISADGLDYTSYQGPSSHAGRLCCWDHAFGTGFSADTYPKHLMKTQLEVHRKYIWLHKNTSMCR